MNKTELIAAVAAKTGLTKEQSAGAVNAVFGTIAEGMAKNDKIQLVGFGTFSAKYRKEKQSVNPKTNAKITVPATYRPAFAAGKTLKEAVAAYKG